MMHRVDAIDVQRFQPQVLGRQRHEVEHEVGFRADRHRLLDDKRPDLGVRGQRHANRLEELLRQLPRPGLRDVLALVDGAACKPGGDNLA